MSLLQQVQRSYTKGPFTLKDPDLNALYGIGGTRTLAGPLVNELTAFTCAAFWNGANQIAADVAKLPLNLLKRRQSGGTDHYTEAKAYRLMKYAPNRETSTGVFRRSVTAHAIVYGNGYAEIVRDPETGRPTALWQLHPNRVRPFYDDAVSDEARRAGRMPLRYLIDGSTVVPAADILHIRGLTDDSVLGFNLVHVAREAIGLALASQQFAAAFFGNGTRFGGILTSDTELDEEGENDLRASIEAMHAKADKAFRLLILDAGLKFQQTGVKPAEAEMKDIRNQQVEEVARFLDMPLHKMKVSVPGAVSYASVEMQVLDYYKGPILTWTRAWEEELDMKLVSPLEWGRQFFKHNNDAFLRGDIKTRYEALAVARSHGVISADDWRELEDMNPLPGGQGAIYLVQGAQVPLDKVADVAQSQIEKNRRPKALPPRPAPGDDDESKALRERAERAEALAAEAKAALAVAEQALDEAQRSGAAKDTDIATLTAEVDRAATAYATLEMVAAEAQREQERASEARAAADTARADAEAARQRAEQQVTEAQAALQQEREAVAAVVADAKPLRERLEQAVAEMAAVQARFVDADALVANLQADVTSQDESRQAAQEMLETARAELVTTQENVAQLQGDLDEATAALEARQADVTAGEAALAEAEASRAALAAEHESVVTAAAEAHATLQAQLVEAQQAADAAREEAVAAAEARTLAEQALVDAEAEARRIATASSDAAVADAQQAADAAREEAVAAAEARTLAEQALAAAEAREAALETERDAYAQRATESRQQQIARLAGVLAAHRSLIEDVVTRMVEREIDRAQSKTTGARLRAWAASFYVTYAETFAEAILPAVRVHLAWRQSGDDPRQVAGQIAADHVAQSRAALEALIGAEAADLQVALSTLLRQWERDRPGQIADRILQDEIAYLQELERQS